MIEYRDWITRDMVRAEHTSLFVFGDNMERRGMGGQAAEMRGEPNAVGIPTKHRPSMDVDAFFTDADLDTWLLEATPDFVRLFNHPGKIVWPTTSIGTGLARLEDRAPKIWVMIYAMRHVLGKMP